jgi:hypothetical protein
LSGVALEFLSIIFALSAAFEFTRIVKNRVHIDGVATAQYVLSFLASLCHLFATAFFLLISALLAKGWNIIRYKIIASGRIKLVVFFVIYLMINFIAVVYDNFSSEAVSSLGQVFSPYFTSMRVVQVVVNIVALIWCSRISIFTITSFQKKKRLLTKIAVFNGFWLILQIIFPCVAGIINAYWLLLYIVLGTYIPNLLFQAVIITLFFPGGTINKLFPFKHRSFDKTKFDVDGPARKEQCNNNSLEQ